MQQAWAQGSQQHLHLRLENGRALRRRKRSVVVCCLGRKCLWFNDQSDWAAAGAMDINTLSLCFAVRWCLEVHLLTRRMCTFCDWALLNCPKSPPSVWPEQCLAVPAPNFPSSLGTTTFLIFSQFLDLYPPKTQLIDSLVTPEPLLCTFFRTHQPFCKYLFICIKETLVLTLVKGGKTHSVQRDSYGGVCNRE